MNEAEIVYTVFDYWDGPRAGAADFHGQPHFYQCVFDEAADEWSNVFCLSPVSEADSPLRFEEWRDWYWWKHDYGQGEAAIEARPETYARYAPVDAGLSQVFRNLTSAKVEAIGEFKALTDPSALPGTAALWRVRWLPLEQGDRANSD